MTLIPEIHDALARAVAGGPARRRGLWRAPRTVLLAAGAIVVSGSAIAATAGWHPILGDDHRGHPQPAQTRLPADQLAALGVLRRDQTDADRSADVQRILKLLPRSEINGVHVDAIRLLRQRPNGATILVPVEREGRHDPGYASSLRRRVLCLLIGIGRPHKSSPTGVAFSAGATCGSARDLRTTGIGLTTSGTHGYILGGLVPDGVARVVIRLRHRRLISAPVRDNYYEVDTGHEVAPGWPVTWIDAYGQTIKHSRNHPYR